MAIQIEEKLLSHKAREALNNAKNKSKLLRDALEAYIRIEPVGDIQENSLMDHEIKQDIIDIKNMLTKLSAEGIQNNDISQQTKIVCDNDIIKSLASVHEMSAATKENNPLKADKQESKVLIKNISEVKSSKLAAGNSISEEKKREIEKMYDFSLESFGE